MNKTPSHYSLNPEPWKVIRSWDLNFNLGNVIKYIARAGRKTADPLEDLKKARHYIDMEIEYLEGQDGTTR